MIVVLSAVGLFFGSGFQITVPLDQSGSYGYLTVKVVDQFGVSVRGSKQSLREVSRPNPELGRIVVWRNGDRVRYGSYYLQVEATGYSPYKGEVIIDEAVETVVVFVRAGLPEGNNRVVMQFERLDPICNMVRLLPVFSVFGRAAQDLFPIVDNRANVPIVPSGDYLLVVSKSEGMCFVKPLRVTGAARQDVRISP